MDFLLFSFFCWGGLNFSKLKIQIHFIPDFNFQIIFTHLLVLASFLFFLKFG